MAGGEERWEPELSQWPGLVSADPGLQSPPGPAPLGSSSQSRAICPSVQFYQIHIQRKIKFWRRSRGWQHWVEGVTWQPKWKLHTGAFCQFIHCCLTCCWMRDLWWCMKWSNAPLMASVTSETQPRFKATAGCLFILKQKLLIFFQIEVPALAWHNFGERGMWSQHSVVI